MLGPSDDSCRVVSDGGTLGSPNGDGDAHDGHRDGGASAGTCTGSCA